ncbi:hypothetical protein [Chryseolinea lacunae]|uniref:Beta-lactamase-inhibitor-like PepSY-like domain-containing protein n=1 Tax=Chryseolinea lacunae TaxID=2801331 RepID=A0ABS1KMX5_9BACT|nr:hypothetical protein [Chryseolinea lacunae]MBL0740597.1 hypothetical protein [Chryseolinea lacunae]
MKRVMLFVAGLLFMTVTATFAQQDTTNTDKTTPQTSDPATIKQNDRTQPSQNYTKDMTKIKVAEVPASLKQTLQSPEYKGWENSSIYRSKANDGYVIEMLNAGQKQTFRFDADGKPIKE